MIALITGILFVFVSFTGTQGQIEGRIVGGITATSANFGCYMTITNTKRDLIGGGALISPFCILTAAAALFGEQLKNLIIQGGGEEINKPGFSFRTIEDIFFMPSFDEYSLKDDLAIIKLRVAMCGPNIRTCKMDFTGKCSDECATIVGFGSSKSRGSISPKLKKAKVRTLSYEECLETEMGGQIGEYNGCHLPCDPEKPTDACDGDTGGPVMDEVKDTVFGILSWGLGCGNATSPGVYMTLANCEEWIIDTMNEHC